jgi:hypothetical protein
MYALGGADALLSTIYNACDKIDITNEAASAVSSGNLSSNRFGAGGVANPAVAGYACGGATNSTTTVTSADKLTFSNDTTTPTSSSNLSAAREQVACLSERSTKAFLAGGETPGTKVATSDKLTFSGDSTSAESTANLTSIRTGPGGMNANSARGYFCGGSPSTVVNCVNTVEKIAFGSTDTTSALGTTLHVKKEQMGCGSDGSTKGYWHGGQTFNGTDGGVDKMTVSTDTDSSLGVSNTNAQALGAGGSDGNKFIHIGGNDANFGATAAGRKVTFATDTEAGFGGTLNHARQAPAGFSQAAL